MRLRREELYFRPSKYNCPNPFDIFAYVMPLAHHDVIVQARGEELSLLKGNVTGLSLQITRRASCQAEPAPTSDVAVRLPELSAPEDTPSSPASTETGNRHSHTKENSAPPSRRSRA
jgi:hypothetical protein